MVNKTADMKIMQMSFMILFVFIFFIMAILFFIMISSSGMKDTYNSLQKDSALSSVETIANMPELNCESSTSFCVDQDKITVFSQISKLYSDFLPVSFIRVRKIYPANKKNIKCPAQNCTYYELYKTKETNIIGRGMFVSICQVKEVGDIPQRICEIGMLDIGVRLAT